MLDASNQVTKKKKQDNKEFNQPTMFVSYGNVEETSNMHHKPRYPLKLCKGDHSLIDCLVIPKVLEGWSKNSYQPTIDPSTNDCEVPRKKCKFRFPCRLCKANQHSQLFPRMDEASILLKKLIVSQQQLPTSYLKLSLNLSSVDEVIYLFPSTFNPTLPLESETHMTQVYDPLIDQVVDSILSSVDATLPLERELNTP